MLIDVYTGLYNHFIKKEKGVYATSYMTKELGLKTMLKDDVIDKFIEVCESDAITDDELTFLLKTFDSNVKRQTAIENVSKEYNMSVQEIYNREIEIFKRILWTLIQKTPMKDTMVNWTEFKTGSVIESYLVRHGWTFNEDLQYVDFNKLHLKFGIGKGSVKELKNYMIRHNIIPIKKLLTYNHTTISGDLFKCINDIFEKEGIDRSSITECKGLLEEVDKKIVEIGNMVETILVQNIKGE